MGGFGRPDRRSLFRHRDVGRRAPARRCDPALPSAQRDSTCTTRRPGVPRPHSPSAARLPDTQIRLPRLGASSRSMLAWPENSAPSLTTVISAPRASLIRVRSAGSNLRPPQDVVSRTSCLLAGLRVSRAATASAHGHETRPDQSFSRFPCPFRAPLVHRRLLVRRRWHRPPRARARGGASGDAHELAEIAQPARRLKVRLARSDCSTRRGLPSTRSRGEGRGWIQLICMMCRSRTARRKT